MLVCYPVAHAIWGATGDFSGIANADAAFKAADFTVGIVVHMTSGWSALLLCVLVAKGLFKGQLIAVLLCIVYWLVMTWIIAKLVAAAIGLRPSEEAEAQDLDIADHGEEGYNANYTPFSLNPPEGCF